MAEKKNQPVADENGEVVVCGFGVRKTYEGQKDFDETYKEVTIKQRVKKVGDGEHDFIIEEYEEVKETPIREVIMVQFDDVGIEAYLRPYQIAGVDVPGVEVGEDIQDFTGYPEDPADAIKIGDQMMANFNSLPAELRGDAKTPEEFFAGLTEEKWKAWLNSNVNVEKGKEENEK